MNILLIEDNEGDIELTARAFRCGALKSHLAVAHDGAEALDYLTGQGKFSKSSRPDLILLDLNMPRMSGREFLEVVKQKPGILHDPGRGVHQFVRAARYSGLLRTPCQLLCPQTVRFPNVHECDSKNRRFLERSGAAAVP